jgi:hypothetical protein
MIQAILRFFHLGSTPAADPIAEVVADARDAITALHQALDEVHLYANQAAIDATIQAEEHQLQVHALNAHAANMDDLHDQTTTLKTALFTATSAPVDNTPTPMTGPQWAGPSTPIGPTTQPASC